jgi:uncharacterized protein YraI
MRNRYLMASVAVLLWLSSVSTVGAVWQRGAETAAYGWLGTIYPYSRPSYDDYFVRNDGQLFGITGATAAVEQQLVGLRGTPVKVWGILKEPAPDFVGRQLVVSEVLAAGMSVTPTPTALGKPQAMISASVANLRTGPSTTYPRIGSAYSGQDYEIVGRDPSSSWWLICCTEGRSTWIYGSLVDARGPLGDVPVVSVAPLPTPAPTPASITEWKGEYFSNPQLSGLPTLVRNDTAVDFNWSDKSPSPALPEDDFSVRWTRTMYFPLGNYRFYATADDGVRLWLDNWPITDLWQAGPVSASNEFNGVGEGSHVLRIEYYEHLGNASVKVWWQRTDVYNYWRGEYFNDIYLQPPAVLIRDDQDINFNWGLGAPASGLPEDNFSVRWTRSVYFDAGDYRFHIDGGDGARLRVDGWLVIDNWLKDTQHSFEGRFGSLGSGYHVLEIDWYSRGGIALVRAWWERLTQQGGPQPD